MNPSLEYLYLKIKIRLSFQIFVSRFRRAIMLSKAEFPKIQSRKAEINPSFILFILYIFLTNLFQRARF
jgi:hypothetical protein